MNFQPNLVRPSRPRTGSLSPKTPALHDQTQPLLWALVSMVVLATAAGPVRAQGVVYVSSEKDHAITLIDLKTQAVTGTLATCKRPRHMQLVAAGKQLAVACGDSAQADFIDLASGKSLRRVGLGNDPEIFDISADGKTLYVSNEEDALLTTIDLTSGQRSGDIKVGGEPEGVKLSADGKWVYVTSEVAHTVHAIDLASGKTVHLIKVGKRPRRLAISPDGLELWVSNELDASVSIIDTRSHKVVATLGFEVKGARKADITPVGLVFSRNGREAFVALGRANHVAFIDVAQRRVTQQVLVGQRAWGVALDGSEQTLVVVNGLSDDVTLVNVASAKAVKTIKVGRVPHTAVVVN